MHARDSAERFLANEISVMRNAHADDGVGWHSIVNNLHKGRDTGPAWRLPIDLSAVPMTFVSVTGMALIFFLAKRRFSGLMAACVGAVLSYVVYLVWVP